MLKCKDHFAIPNTNSIYKIINTGKKTYTTKLISGTGCIYNKPSKATCHELIRQKLWIVGDLSILKVLYGKV